MSEGAPETVPVCLLVNGETVTEWQHRALERMVAETAAEITVVVSNRREESRSKTDLVRDAVELREWTAVWLLRSLFADPIRLSGDVEVTDRDYLEGAEWIDCVPETVDGWKNEIPADVVAEVTDDADVAVRFGFGFLVGDLLTDLEHGVLSYHHGDLREYRGQPAGCWEYIHGEDEVGITLQRINEQLDAGEVVASERVAIDDAETYAEIRSRLYENSEDLLARAVSKIERGDTDFEVVDDLGQLYTIPQGVPALRFLLKEIRGNMPEVSGA